MTSDFQLFLHRDALFQYGIQIVIKKIKKNTFPKAPACPMNIQSYELKDREEGYAHGKVCL